MKTIKILSALLLLLASYTATAQNVKIYYKNGETKILRSEDIDSMVFVKVCRADGVKLNESSVTLPIGGTVQLTATVTPEDAEDKEVTWSSSDESIATVSNEGLVTSISEGKAVITVKTADGGYTAECNVEVKVYHPESIKLNKSSVDIPLGGTTQLTATIAPDNAENKNVTWSSSDESVATISNDGLVTSIKEGTTIITVTTEDGGLKAECMVNVKIFHAEKVTLDKTSVSLMESGTTQLVATVTPEEAENKNVTWSSSDESIATVSNDGVVTGVGKGTATITVTTEEGEHTATCTVTVKDITEYVSVSRTGMSTSIINGQAKYGVSFSIKNSSTETIHLTSLAGVAIEQDLAPGQSYSISLQGSTAYIQNYYQKLLFTYNGKTYSVQG